MKSRKAMFYKTNLPQCYPLDKIYNSNHENKTESQSERSCLSIDTKILTAKSQ